LVIFVQIYIIHFTIFFSSPSPECQLMIVVFEGKEGKGVYNVGLQLKDYFQYQLIAQFENSKPAWNNITK